MSFEQNNFALVEAEDFSQDKSANNQNSTAVSFGESQFTSESQTYEIASLQTSYGKVFLERTLQEHPNPTEQEIIDAKHIFKEFDRQQFENLTQVESTRFPGVKFTKSSITLSPQTMLSMYPQPQLAEQVADPEVSSPVDKKTIVLWGSFAAPPDGHALSMGDAIFDRAIQEIAMVANRMDTENPIQVDIHIIGSPTGLGGEVTPEYVKDLAKRGLDASSKMFAEFIKENLLPAGFMEATPDQQVQLLQGQQYVFEGASRGAILADKAFSAMPDLIKAITTRRLDNPAGHHGDSKSWMLKGLKAGVGLIKEFKHNLSDNQSPLRDLMAADKELYQNMANKLNIPLKDSPSQALLKLRAIGSELKALGRGEKLSEDATHRYIVRAMEDKLTMDPYKRAQVLKHVSTGTLANNMIDGEQGKEFYVEGGHFFKPYERYTTDDNGNLGTWWRMINFGRKRVNELRQPDEQL